MNKLIIKVSIASFLLVTLLNCNHVKELYVPFGSAKQIHAKQSDDVIRIYFDRLGFVYPDETIDDKDIYACYGKLNLFYSTHPAFYTKICEKYKVKSIDSISERLAGEVPLQDSILQKYVTLINNKRDNRDIVFIIHGFNEYPITTTEPSSFDAMKKTREIIAEQFKDKKFLFVEVYWDGLSHEKGNKILRYPNSFKIWSRAQVNATYVGLELRRLLANLNAPRINVITHSHGAGIITTALFNVKKFRDELYDRKSSWLYYINLNYNNKLYNTPKQEFHVGMLAPAIPGENVFRKLYWRTVEGENIKTALKNYSFIVGFNENDPVTSKYRTAPTKLGSTSLACMPKELRRTENLYKDSTIITHVDFSKNDNGTKQSDHSWFKYLSNTSKRQQFLDSVFR